MSFYRRIELSLIIAIITSVLFSIISFAHTAEKIRGEVLRLHVIANSDSCVDQNLKLAVRDAILEEGSDIFDGSVTVENAVNKISPQINKLTSVAEKVVKIHGFNYAVNVRLDEEYFNTRTYETVTLPAGKYLSLVVTIGSGEGKNWWCVMFPPMCLSAADESDVISNVLNKEEVRLVNSKPKYEPRFKIIEIIEEIKNDILK